jgi:beta-glucosidase
MKYFITTILIVTSFFSSAQKNNIESKVATLLKKMTLEEKVGQMAQITLDVLGDGTPFKLNEGKTKDAIVKFKLGSVLNTSDNRAMTLEQWNKIVKTLQSETKNTSLQIPLIYGFDAIHGATYVAGATFFPQPIGQAATWNKQLVFDAASITAYESSAANITWNFSPVLDLGVNPLWARIWETLGEDPFLVSELGKQIINGYQNPIGDNTKVAACLKHYLAYSDPKTGKDRTNTWMSENYLREYHLPSFKAAVEAGAQTVMVNSALINGLPTHINKHLLTDVLKKELGFKGFVVTDWQDIDNIYKRDKIVATQKEALMLAINAGIDMAMIPYEYQTFCKDLISLVKENKVPISRINDAVNRILTVKYELNLFEKSNSIANDYSKFASNEFIEKAKLSAAESIVLLKNENNILPLKSDSKVLITGPNAHSMRTLNGGWSYSWQGEKTEDFANNYNTIFEAFQNEMGNDNISFSQGVAYKMNGKYFEDSIVNIDDAINKASNVDYVLLCVGENSYTEKPGDLNDLNLSENQQLLIDAMIKTGKKIILVLNEGRPRNISKFEPKVAAILDAFIPGNYGGDALANIVLGKINPSGKMPITYPRYVNALTNYIHKPSDEQSNPQGAYDYSADYNPQFDFGFGLSYTTFQYSDLKFNKSNFNTNDTILVSVKVKNTGNISGKEVVQLFSSDLVASLTPDVKRLREFEKVALKAGESKEINFKIPVKSLAFVNEQNKYTVEKGSFKISINNLSGFINVDKTAIW